LVYCRDFEPPMPLHSWRRFHGTRIVAQVEPNESGMWGAMAWNSESPSGAATVRLKRLYSLLTSAQAAADHAARTRFNHKCDFGTCGVWSPWTHE
jgi:hypothetical protein